MEFTGLQLIGHHIHNPESCLLLQGEVGKSADEWKKIRFAGFHDNTKRPSSSIFSNSLIEKGI